MVETGAGGMSKVDLSAITEDLVPSVTNTYNIGLSDAQWAAIWVTIAIVTSIAIGGAIGLSNVDGWLFVNASTHVNGSLNVSENITAVNITASGNYYGNASEMDGLPTPDNESWNESHAFELFVNQSDFIPANFSWNQSLGDTLYADISVTGDNSSWNETHANTLYATIAQILAFNYYNSTDFDIADYLTSATILGFSYYNATDFDIADYLTSATILGFGYYNASDFDIADYLTSASIFGFGYYNSSDFDIADYFTSTQILGFGYWNSTWAGFNKTYADGLYSTKAEPLWSANYTAYNTTWSSTYNATYHAKVSFPGWNANLAWINETNIFTANQNLTAKNISTINCIVFDSGGQICSEV